MDDWVVHLLKTVVQRCVPSSLLITNPDDERKRRATAVAAAGFNQPKFKDSNGSGTVDWSPSRSRPRERIRTGIIVQASKNRRILSVLLPEMLLLTESMLHSLYYYSVKGLIKITFCTLITGDYSSRWKEKRFQRNLVNINLDDQFQPEFVLLNPKCEVPPLHKGTPQHVIDSTAISNYLEEK